MDRQKLINELNNKINAVTTVLVMAYRHDLVLEFLSLERELQIQISYQTLEKNY